MAIAFDSQNKFTACVTGTSCTYSFTNTAGNFVANGSVSYTTDPGVTTMKYAGVSMTQLGSNQGIAAVAFSYSFYKASAATGANNIVTTTTNSLTNGFFDHVVSYSGTAASPVTNVVQQVTVTETNDSIPVTIGTTASSWAVWCCLGSTLGRGYTAGANTILRVSDAQAVCFDSNGVASSSPWTLNATITSGTEAKLDTAFELLVSAATATAKFLPMMGVGS